MVKKYHINTDFSNYIYVIFHLKSLASRVQDAGYLLTACVLDLSESLPEIQLL